MWFQKNIVLVYGLSYNQNMNRGGAYWLATVDCVATYVYILCGSLVYVS